MDRKKTILTAVLINAGLLAILFIAALVTREEEGEIERAWVEAPHLPPTYQEEAPPFSASYVEAPLPQEVPVAASPIEIPESLVKVEEPIHKLPPVKEGEPLFKEPAPLAAEPAKKGVSSDWIEVVVKKGDSLEKIAKAHHVTVDAIIKKNQLPSSFLRIGQVLKVPTEKNLAISPKLKPLAPVEKTAGPEYYTVKVGDNPWTIAMTHHMKVEELLRLNGLNEEKARKLKPGDRLRIR